MFTIPQLAYGTILGGNVGVWNRAGLCGFDIDAFHNSKHQDRLDLFSILIGF